MTKDNKATEDKMEKQREVYQQEEQNTTVSNIGWKSAGLLFVAIIIALVIYAIFSR